MCLVPSLHSCSSILPIMHRNLKNWECLKGVCIIRDWVLPFFLLLAGGGGQEKLAEYTSKQSSKTLWTPTHPISLLFWFLRISSEFYLFFFSKKCRFFRRKISEVWPKMTHTSPTSVPEFYAWSPIALEYVFFIWASGIRNISKSQDSNSYTSGKP